MFYNTTSSISSELAMLSFIWNSASYVWKKASTVLWSSNLRPSRNLQCGRRYRKGGLLYAFHLQNEMFKVGKTIELKQRIRPYRTVVPHGYTFHTVRCENIDESEKILHSMLKLAGHHYTKEIFTVSGDVLKEYMKFVANLERILIGSENRQKLVKIARFLDEIK
jgi:hypothetical protein